MQFVVGLVYLILSVAEFIYCLWTDEFDRGLEVVVACTIVFMGGYLAIKAMQNYLK